MSSLNRTGRTKSIEYLRLSANIKLSMLYQDTVQPGYKASRNELQLKYQRAKARVIEIPAILGNCFGLIHHEKSASKEAKFQFLPTNPFVMSAYAAPFRPNSPKKAATLATRVNSENPEDDEGPCPEQKEVKLPEKHTHRRIFFDEAELELQARCVRMVEDLVDEVSEGPNQVSSYRQRLLKFQ